MLKSFDVFLSDLKVGQRAMIVDVLIDDNRLRNRFFEMGITKGVFITIKKIAPLGDPISFLIRGYELSIRRMAAKSILVEVLK